MPAKRTIDERFWERVQKTEDCWLWVRPTHRAGYGELRTSSYVLELAHRLSWRLHFGDVPAGLYVLHKCDNPPCVRPDHLFLGTPKDNTHDMIQKDRHSHRLTIDNVRDIRLRYALGGITQLQLAIEYGMDRSTIGYIVRNKLWAHV